MKQKNHNTHFYSIQEVERCLKSTEEFEDGEQLYYFIGALRYVYDENKKKDKEIERLNNIIKSLFDYCKEQQEKSFDSVAEECYAEVMYFISERLEKIKELKESGNNE